MAEHSGGSQRGLTRKSVVKLAQRYLDERQPPDYRMVGREDKVQRENGIWYVQVDPVPENVSAGDFISRMVDATMDLQEREGVDVELTNMLPRDLMAAEMLMPTFATAVARRKRMK